MAEARLRADWAQTAALLCLTANVHRDPRRRRPFRPRDFNPYAPRRRPRRVSVARLTAEILMVAESRGCRPPRRPAGPGGG